MIPSAVSAADVRRLAASTEMLDELDARITHCRACPRLVAWREQVARAKRAAYATETYWGRPVPGWGDAQPRILIAGLAPPPTAATGPAGSSPATAAATGCSRRSTAPAWPPSPQHHRGDGQQLIDTRMLAAVRCAPPANKPTIEERDTCAPWFREEVRRVWPSVGSVIALGAFAWQAVWHLLGERRPAFGHGAAAEVDGRLIIASYHPSQQNTFTGKLTAPCSMT